jgi:hypothetical protein
VLHEDEQVNSSLLGHHRHGQFLTGEVRARQIDRIIGVTLIDVR